MSRELRDLIRSVSSGSYPPIRKRFRKSYRRNRRTLKKWAWDATDGNFNYGNIMENNEKIFLGVSDFDDLITSDILKRRVDVGRKTVHRDTTVLCNREHWAAWAENQYANTLYVQGNSSGGFIIFEKELNYITYSVDSNTTTVRAFGDIEFCENVIVTVENKFDIVTSHIEWIYSSDGNSVNVPLNRDRLPVEEMYPFLKGESLESYYNRYLESSANILLLIGPPGTGKTTFIRGLLAMTNSSAIVSYDSAILEKDSFFARFIEGDETIMVLEDSDAFLKSRSDGNTMMHRFLNVGDGLVTTKGKKMIFSTNLPSIRDIDSALVRPGRCFDIITFDTLKQEEAELLAKRLDVKLDGKQDKWSIAEVFNKQTNKPKDRKMGFV
jgi:hypothetical protein